MPEPVCWPRPKDSCCLEFSLHMQADHNREGLSVKDHISYTRKSSRSYVALDAATKEEAGDGSYGLQGETLLNLYKGLSRDLSASRPRARPRDRTTRRVPPVPPRKTAGSRLRSSPKPRTRRAAAPVSCSGTSGTRLFVCRRPAPRTRAGIPCRRTQRWA